MPSKITELSTLDPRSPALWMDANIFKASAAWWLTVDRMKAKHFWGRTPPNVIFISGQEKMKKHISCNIPNVCLYMNLYLFMLLNLSSMNVSNVLQKILPFAITPFRPIQICKWLAADAIPSSQSIQRFKDFLQHPAAPTVIIPWASFFGSAGLKGRLSLGSVRSVALHLPSTTWKLAAWKMATSQGHLKLLQFSE